MPTLTYFDARGVVEVTRYMLAIAGTDYTDTRFSISFGTPGDFSTIVRPEFDAAKANGELAISNGKLPKLEWDGHVMGQSKAIERFVAKKVGMMGASDAEAALIDMQLENIRDIKDAYQKAKKEENKDEAVAKYFAETLKDFLAGVASTMPSGGPFVVGDAVSLADVAFFVFLTEFFDNKEGAKAATPARIQEAVDAVAALDAVKAWQDKRPKTMF